MGAYHTLSHPADCPQVQCVHPYVAQQPDELTLELADILNILEKTEDGEAPRRPWEGMKDCSLGVGLDGAVGRWAGRAQHPCWCWHYPDILPEHWAQHPWLSSDFLSSCELPCSFPSSRPDRCFSVSHQPCLWPQPSPRRELNPDLNLFGHKLLGSPETTRP